MPQGRAGIKQFFAMTRRGLPDYHATVEDEAAEGDKVMYRVTFRGTHQGELMGIPPTGKQVTIAAIDIFRIAEGKIAEHWGIADKLGLLQQLGVAPGPPAPLS